MLFLVGELTFTHENKIILWWIKDGAESGIFLTCSVGASFISCVHAPRRAAHFAKGGGAADAKRSPNVVGSLNALDKCAVCKGANLIFMVWNFKGIYRCNCLTRESINHCSVRSSCNFFPNAGIYFPSILFFFSFNLARSFERLIATIFKNNKLVSHVANAATKKKHGLSIVTPAPQKKNK